MMIRQSNDIDDNISVHTNSYFYIEIFRFVSYILLTYLFILK